MFARKLSHHLRILLLMGGVYTAMGNVAEATDYPLTLKNCGRTLIFDKAPQSVVSAGQNSTEILYLLGLADKVQATALWFKPVLPEFAEVNEKIERISSDMPSFEAVVAKKPQLVASQYEWLIGANGVTGTYEQFDEVGIPVYTSAADCAKDNNAGSDGLRTEPFTMELIYQEISELAQIFDVEERGRELIAALKDREQSAIDRVKNLGTTDLSAVMWYSSADMEMDPYVAGQMGAPGYILRTLGIRNIVQSDHEWPTVGWETIARANPDIIVMADMARRRFPADDIEVKREFLATDPVTSLLPAVKNQQLVGLDVQAMNGSIHTITALEVMAQAIEQFALKK